MLYEMDIFIDRYYDRHDGWSNADVSASDWSFTASRADRELVKFPVGCQSFFFLAD